jgi:hypothetical protein
MILHRFTSAVPAGGNPGNVTGPMWNDGHIALLVSTAYSASGSIPVWSYVQGAPCVEFAECSGTITLTLPAGNSFPGMNLEFLNVGSGTITITDGGSFTVELVNTGQSVRIYQSTITGAWQIRSQSA